VLGKSQHTWASRTGATRYLPDLIAAALREAGGTDAVMPWVVPRLAELLGRDLAGEPASGGARAGLLRVLEAGERAGAQPGR
jgi:hypothetical protein